MDLQYLYSVMVTLENNTADEAVSALYGGVIDNCYTTGQKVIHTVDNNTVFRIIFKILHSYHKCHQILLCSMCAIMGILLEVK